MSRLDEKLASSAPPRSTGTRAQATRQQLFARSGTIIQHQNGNITVDSMGGVTLWTLISGDPESAKAVFELTSLEGERGPEANQH